MDEQLRARVKTLLKIILWAALAGAIGFFVLAYITLQRSAPPREGTLTLSGIKSPIEITFDAMGIPQVWAKNEFDAYFGMGYLHASDRLFQMDMARRLSQGRLSELLGDMAVEYDLRQRRMRHYHRAQQAVDNLTEVDQRRLRSYVDGINAYVASCEAMPFEFYIMQTEFEPWTIEDCLTLLVFQTWFSDALQNRDEFFVNLALKFGRDSARTLLFDYPDWAPTTVGPPDEMSAVDGAVDADKPAEASVLRGLFVLNPLYHVRKAIYQSLFAYARTPMRMTESSNAWAISADKSHSGHAILASDPHLEISRLPQFWYCLAIHAPKDRLDVFGITSPGLPFFAMGHNGKAAWAFTAAGVDVTEYYEEKVNPEDSSQYLTPDGWKSFDVIQDTMSFDDRDTVITIRYTRHGPVVISDDSLHRCYSLRWAGMDFSPARMMAHSFGLHHVKTFTQFRQIVDHLGALDASWIYADENGNIGYQLGTPVPERPSGIRDNLSQPGWTDSLEWLGYRELFETPNYVNPPRGWLTSNNNKPERSARYPLDGNFAADRILRITGLLKDIDDATVADMYRFQMDQIDEYLPRWKPEMEKLLRDLGHRELAEQIAEWDGSTGVDSRPTLIANLFLSRLIRLTFEDQFGEKTQWVRKIWMDQYFHSDDTIWYNDTTTDTTETKSGTARKAMQETVEIIGDDTWGDRHTLTMRHPLAVIPILGGLLDLAYGPWPRSGTAGTLNASFFRESEENRFKTFVAPSWRFVVDFQDVNKATIVLPTGNSGNPASPHFADFLDMWRAGERWQVPFERKLVRNAAVSRLVLQPATE